MPKQDLSRTRAAQATTQFVCLPQGCVPRERALELVVAALEALGQIAAFVLEDHAPPPTAADFRHLINPLHQLAAEFGVDTDPWGG